jgi:predicted secreted protein
MALSAATFGFNTKLQVGDGGGTEVFTTIAELTSISTNFSADDVEVTSHDSTDRWRDYLQGLKGLEITMEGNFLPTNDTHDITAGTGMMFLFDAGTKRNYKLIFPTPTPTTWTCAGILTNVSHSAPMDAQLSFSATLRTCGEPTMS